MYNDNARKKNYCCKNIQNMLYTSLPLFLQYSLCFACRHYGTINLLSALTSEAVKSVLVNQSEEETWGVDSLDILLETWNVILGVLPLSFAQIQYVFARLPFYVI